MNCCREEPNLEIDLFLSKAHEKATEKAQGTLNEDHSVRHLILWLLYRLLECEGCARISSGCTTPRATLRVRETRHLRTLRCAFDALKQRERISGLDSRGRADTLNTFLTLEGPLPFLDKNGPFLTLKV